MKVRITFSVPQGVDRTIAAALLQGQEIDVDGFAITQRGELTLTRGVAPDGNPRILAVYNAEVWRSAVLVGEFQAAVKAAQEAANEDPRNRRQG